MAPFSTEKHEITDLQTGNSEGWLEQEYQEITFFYCQFATELL